MAAKCKVIRALPPPGDEVAHSIDCVFLTKETELFELVYQVTLATSVLWGNRRSCHKHFGKINTASWRYGR